MTTPAKTRQQRHRLRQQAIALGIDPETIAPKQKRGRKPLANPSPAALKKRESRAKKKQHQINDGHDTNEPADSHESIFTSQSANKKLGRPRIDNALLASLKKREYRAKKQNNMSFLFGSSKKPESPKPLTKEQLQQATLQQLLEADKMKHKKELLVEQGRLAAEKGRLLEPVY